MLKVNLRLRMFLCSSSSAVGLWLNRLKKTPRSILRILLLEYLCVFHGESSPGSHLHRQPECSSCQVINQLVFVQKTTEGSWRKTVAKTPFVRVSSSSLAGFCSQLSNVYWPLIAYRVSLVAVCCRDSSRSWSDCSGRMFFSSSSLFDGRLLSLMARESFLKTFMASVPSVTRW